MAPKGYELVEYRDALDGRPFARWKDSLDFRADSKVTVVLQRLAAGNAGDTKSLGGGLHERRIHWGPGYRLYFGRDGGRVVVLLGGGTKASQSRDIVLARRRWVDYQLRRCYSVIRLY
jgi:putative addiction module killer protein